MPMKRLRYFLKMFKKIQHAIKSPLARGVSTGIYHYALSCSMGVYIGFSPFVGCHTLLVFLCSWLFNLNYAIVFMVSNVINNPWTLIPIYWADYIVGKKLCMLLGIEQLLINPVWLQKLVGYMPQTVASCMISLWAFLLGGNVVGVSAALLCYMSIVLLCPVWMITYVRKLVKMYENYYDKQKSVI